jgi:hypothetical protein
LWPNGPFRTPKKFGQDMLFACFDEKTLGEHPKALYLNGTKVQKPSDESLDESKQKQLWEGTIAIAGIREVDTVLRDWK